MAMDTICQTMLPQELVEHIIDILWDHRSALKSCALVSRAWWPRSQYHLCRIVVLSSRDDTDREATFRDPFVASLVRQLTIISESSTHWLKWFPKILHSVDRMPRVTRLRIISTNWDVRLGDGYFRAQGPSLVYLTLVGVNFDSFATFTYVIAAFPKLESLSLLYVRWAARLGPMRHEDCANGSQLKLKTLRLGWSFSSLAGRLKELVDWLQWRRLEPLSIQHLALGATLPNDEFLQDILLRLSSSLRVFDVYQRIHHIRSLDVDALDATLADPSFTKLQTVTITGITYEPGLLNASSHEMHVEEKLPALAQRKKVKTFIRMRVQDPSWFEKPLNFDEY